MIKQNEGTLDRIIRVVVGIVALYVAYAYLAGPMQIGAYVVGVAALITGIIGYCGLYALLGISTCPVKKK